MWFWLLLSVGMSVGVRGGGPSRAPAPKHGSGSPFTAGQRELVAARLGQWTDQDAVNPWELSGLLEGDMLMAPDGEHGSRNGLLDASKRWENATVPYQLEENHFSDQDGLVIVSAFREYHERTCIRFRPYQPGDRHWVTFRSNDSGCWSSVGRQDEGQTVHLQAPGCVRHGVVVHELLHALGFYHQQSDAHRDQYVQIRWDNIKDGHEHNFQKYNESTVTDYGVPYDYGSVMHYSEKAFSKNGEPTIVALQPNVTFGQRDRMSDGDATKLNKMYDCDRHMHAEEHTQFLEHLASLLNLLELSTDALLNFGRHER